MMQPGKNTPPDSSVFAIRHVAVFAIVVMLIGFLIGRAVLSAGMLVFVVNAVLRGHWQRPVSTATWLLPGLWVAAYALSGLWTDNQHEWWDNLQLKLPVVLLTLGFLMLPAFHRPQRRGIIGALLAAMLAGMVYSIAMYLRNPGLYAEEANHSLLIPTLAYGNHIVFSMATALTILMAVWALPIFSKVGRWLVGVAVALLVVYLHILAAKTGLLLLYVFGLLLFIRQLFLPSTRLRALGALVAAVALLALAYWKVPTFRGRMQYTAYSARMFWEGDRTGNYSDVGRVLSWKVGSTLIARNPLLGVGGGDWRSEMATVYRAQYPQVDESQYLIPHNQFVATATLAGIPAALLLLGWFVLMIFRRAATGRDRFFNACVWLLLLAGMFVDALLEVQFGVFVFLMFGLLAWHFSRSGMGHKSWVMDHRSCPMLNNQ